MRALSVRQLALCGIENVSFVSPVLGFTHKAFITKTETSLGDDMPGRIILQRSNDKSIVHAKLALHNATDVFAPASFVMFISRGYPKKEGLH